MNRIIGIVVIFMAGFITESWGAKIRIDIRDDIGYKFTRAGTNIFPARETISVGDTVEWVNIGFMAHTTTSDVGIWDSGLLGSGGRFSFAFTQAGVFPYQCSPHVTFGQRDTVYVFLCTAKPGDANGDNKILLSDAVAIINYIFRETPLDPICRGDANGDGSILFPDVVYLINFLFKSGPAPVKYTECCL